MIFYKESFLVVESFVPSKNIAIMKPSNTSCGGLLVALLLTGAAAAQTSAKRVDHIKQKELQMSVVQQNKETIQKLFDQALNKKRFDLLPEYVSEEYVGIRGSKGATAFQEPLQSFLQAVPDVRWTLDELVGEGNTVIVWWTTKGTHTGPFVPPGANGRQLPPTGEKVTNTGVGFFKLKQGKVVASRALTDRLGFLQELGVLPADLTTLASPKTP